MKDLVNLLTEYDPKELSNGEIRTKCLHRENHTDGSGNMSMFLSQDKNTYHCFSCGAKGRLTYLLESKFELSIFEAIEYVNVSLDSLESYDEKERKFVEEAKSEVKIELPKRPHKSFIARGFTLDTLKNFKVGFLKEEGKLIHTIPMLYNDKVVGVKYRQDLPYRTFWYSTDFDRRRFLYNEPTEKEEVIVVEGETDVWRSYQNGFKNVVATLGTQVNEEQAERLRKFKKVILAFDNDFAGSVATEKVYRMLKDHTEVLFMPYDAEDPGSCSTENWSFAYNNCSDYLSYQLAMYELLEEGAYENILAKAGIYK